MVTQYKYVNINDFITTAISSNATWARGDDNDDDDDDDAQMK
jgi:hypothetical protein